MRGIWLLLLVFLGELPSARAQSVQTPASPALVAGDGAEVVLPALQARRKSGPTPLAQFVNTVTAPWRLVSGYLSGDCGRAVPTLDDLARMAPGTVTPAETTAAKIVAEETGAKWRRAAVRYLGTVDHHYYPEAEAALVAALRADRNELVRLEAAQALATAGFSAVRTVEDAASGRDRQRTGRQPCRDVRTGQSRRHGGIATLRKSRRRRAPRPDTSDASPPCPRGRNGWHSIGKLCRSGAGDSSASPRHSWRANFRRKLRAPASTSPRSVAGGRNLFQQWIHAGSSREAPDLPRTAPTPPATAARTIGLTPIGQVPGE